MRVSELIVELQRVADEHGDILVNFIGTLSEDPETDTIPIAGLATCLNDDDEAVAVTICDDLTLDAFAAGDTDL